ncbi:Rv2175c family DNA-binding protein [Leifsonia lichenia]|uniref:Rv2175c family DNA-binding protein n=1 Tax=unclassified Leifsonia TaxID=2663824 RepID=UPI0006FA78F0|nr:Rv2175c family DNA-binding protein [Leifsonia sp. Root227]KRC49811.1 transcriptional regulator [Leifsonia sp. Root227]
MTEQAPAREWLTIPDLVDSLGLGVSRVRRLIDDRHLAAKRIDGVLKVPSDFLKDGQPLGELRGTLIVLGDAGFDDEEAVDWLIQEDEVLGTAPIDALRAGRKAEVRRVAQALA